MDYTLIIQTNDRSINWLIDCLCCDVEAIKAHIVSFLKEGKKQGYDVDETICELDNELMDKFECVVHEQFEVCIYE